ncbi:hypothetical protein CO179_00935 [candidate division WWE3 bacterium CG_4_9_14_3_um_filter_39_7]|uniref:Uncharacterized protein n=1 Tax=candidate division WWE3 bacterium CG_4_9_14_3_um_filter_39_7 TaxID=1975080 RepID=A0A2M7X467_UNCKA|nr:MAG: hypothetical protein CO179_00935 [candidate division WWE3 bacterium CG_4_9_14_3_um_filter_39_7]
MVLYADKKNVAIMDSKRIFLHVINGKMNKVGGLTKKALWMPAPSTSLRTGSAGITTDVGGNSQ